ncbi:hypothetical protein BASA81_004809 [Batrachochytrium salamandrivorans]|nr:hypothetical protein BASA81_004809 [Batrachochytrium salamandrivorans]
MALSNLSNLVLGWEARRDELQREVIRKQALVWGLPPLDFCELNEPQVQYCRLSDPKRDGKSLKKKQCDLWEFCWGAGSLLAYLVAQVDVFTGKRCLELGGGIGLASLAVLSKYQVQELLMTDLVEDALRVFELSIRLQRCLLTPSVSVRTKTLNWNKPQDYDGEGRFDVVFGSDVLFMSWCAPLVAKICAKCLRPDGGLVFVLDPFRLNDGLFQEALQSEGLGYFKSFILSELLIQQVALPLQDKLGSFVPVKRAKLLVASNREINQELIAKLLGVGGLKEEEA